MENTDIAHDYIAAVADLYNINDKVLGKMYDGADQINEALGKYYWDDVLHALQKFYTYHSDKSRPRLAQIIALLESDRDVKPREPELKTVDNRFCLPKTNLWSINETFNKLVSVLVDAGVIPNDKGELSIKRSIVDPKTDLPVLNPYQWLRWQLNQAMGARPDIFVSVPVKTFYEHLALAVQNKLITIRVRDWSKKVGGTK